MSARAASGKVRLSEALPALIPGAVRYECGAGGPAVSSLRPLPAREPRPGGCKAASGCPEVRAARPGRGAEAGRGLAGRSAQPRVPAGPSERGDGSEPPPAGAAPHLLDGRRWDGPALRWAGPRGGASRGRGRVAGKGRVPLLGAGGTGSSWGRLNRERPVAQDSSSR